MPLILFIRNYMHLKSLLIVMSKVTFFRGDHIAIPVKKGTLYGDFSFVL